MGIQFMNLMNKTPQTIKMKLHILLPIFLQLVQSKQCFPEVTDTYFWVPIENGQVWYMVPPITGTWAELEQFCTKLDKTNGKFQDVRSGLAKFYNVDENNVVKGLSITSDHWINGITFGQTGKWFFYDSNSTNLEEIVFTNWGPGEPNNQFDVNEDVITVGHLNDKTQWSDYVSKYILPGICEWRC